MFADELSLTRAINDSLFLIGASQFWTPEDLCAYINETNIYTMTVLCIDHS